MTQNLHVCPICCRPEVDNDVISGVAIYNVGMDVPMNFRDSRSNGFRDIRGADSVSNDRTNERTNIAEAHPNSAKLFGISPKHCSITGTETQEGTKQSRHVTMKTETLKVFSFAYILSRTYRLSKAWSVHLLDAWRCFNHKKCQLLDVSSRLLDSRQLLTYGHVCPHSRSRMTALKLVPINDFQMIRCYYWTTLMS